MSVKLRLVRSFGSVHQSKNRNGTERNGKKGTEHGRQKKETVGLISLMRHVD